MKLIMKLVFTLLTFVLISSIAFGAVNVLFPINDIVTNSSSLIFNHTMAGSTSCLVKIDGNNVGTLSPVANTNTTFIHSSVDGKHNWSVSCTNATSNENSSASSFTLDTKPPVVSLDKPVDGLSTITTTNSLSWGVEDNIDTSIACDLIVNSIVNSSVSTPSITKITKFISGMTNGTYSWKVSCVDDAGNIGNSVLRSFTVDTASPSVNLLLSSKDILHGDNIGINCQATDNVYVPQISVDIKNPAGATKTVFVTSGQFLEFKETNITGTYFVTCTAVDSAGNSAEKKANFTVSTTKTLSRAIYFFPSVSSAEIIIDKADFAFKKVYIELTKTQNLQLEFRLLSDKPSNIPMITNSTVIQWIEAVHDGEISSAKINFRILNSDSNGANISLYSYNGTKNATWKQLETTKIEGPVYSEYQAISNNLGLFAIGTETAICGNNIIERGEMCDGNNLRNNTCVSLGFTMGNVVCTKCVLNTSNCTICGNVICETEKGENNKNCAKDCPTSVALNQTQKEPSEPKTEPPKPQTQPQSQAASQLQSPPISDEFITIFIVAAAAIILIITMLLFKFM